MVIFKVALGTGWHKRNLQLHHSRSIIPDAWESYTQPIFHSFRFVQLYDPIDFHTSHYTLNHLLFRANKLNSSAYVWYGVFHSLSWCSFGYVLSYVWYGAFHSLSWCSFGYVLSPHNIFTTCCVLLIYPRILPEIKLPLRKTLLVVSAI